MRRGICKQNETEKEKKSLYMRESVLQEETWNEKVLTVKKKKRKRRKRSQADFGRANTAASSRELSVCVCLFCVDENFAREMELHWLYAEKKKLPPPFFLQRWR